MKYPVITVITVVLNAKITLEQTILSVIDQNYPNIQYIIIDGGSTDGTVDIIKKFENEIDYWVSEPDGGVYDAMNKAIKKAKGDWVYFIGAGDILLYVLNEIALKLSDENCVYYGDVYWVEKQEIYDGYFSPYKLAIKNICHQSVFYPVKALKKYQFDLRYKVLADHFLNIRIYSDKTFRFEYIKMLICNYQGGGFSAAHPVDLNFFRDRMEIIQSGFSFPVFCYAYLRTKVAGFFKLINFASLQRNND